MSCFRGATSIVVLFSLFVFVFHGVFAQVRAAVVPGAVHNWDAALDTDGGPRWEDTGSQGGLGWYLLGRVERVAVDSSTALTHAYRFDGINDIGEGDVDNRFGNHDTTFELWFKPNGFPEGDTRTIFDYGNFKRGLSFGLSGDNLVLTFGAKVTWGQLTFDLDVDDNGIDNPDFIQIVGVVDDTNDQLRLYVDGGNEQTLAIGSGGNDFTSNDGAGLGAVVGVGGGGLIGSPLTWGGRLDADIAVLREYRWAFGPAEVAQNYNALAAPEPASVVLAALGLIAGAGLLGRRGARLH